MSCTRLYQRTVAAGLILMTALGARAQDVEPAPGSPAFSEETQQVIYKGVVGNLLEAVPLDAERRVTLQRTNAVVSNALSGRTLAPLLGIANPVLLIGGLVWGLYAASQIKAPVVQSVANAKSEFPRDDRAMLCFDAELLAAAPAAHEHR